MKSAKNEIINKYEQTEQGRQDIIGGLNQVLAALKARVKTCRSLMVAEGRSNNSTLNEIFRLAKEYRITARVVPRQALSRVYGDGNHQGVIALFDLKESINLDDFLQTLPQSGPALVVALDKVEDPGNLGAIMRSALAFGACGIICPKDRSAAVTPAAVAASAGASEFLTLVKVVNLARSLDDLKKYDFWVVGAEEDKGEALGKAKLPERMVLVLGSEGRGMGTASENACDLFVHIPQSRGEVQSLNVSVAGAIIMSEHFRCFHN